MKLRRGFHTEGFRTPRPTQITSYGRSIDPEPEAEVLPATRRLSGPRAVLRRLARECDCYECRLNRQMGT